MKVKNNYKHLVQKPELCFATVLAMVAFRRDVWIDEEKIAKDLGVKLTKDVEQCYNYSFEIAEGIEDAGYGIRHINMEDVNRVLKEHGVNVEAEYHKLSEIEDVEKFIEENLKEDNDVAVLFSLKAMGFHERSWYHWALVSSYDTDSKTVEVCDPEDTHKTYWEAPLEDFLIAMSDKWDGEERGFMVFKDKE